MNLMQKTGLAFLGIVAIGLCLGATPAQAATNTWDGQGGADRNWTTATNWTPDVVPSGADIAKFQWGSAGPIYVNFDTDPTVSNVLMQGDGRWIFTNSVARLTCSNFTFASSFPITAHTIQPALTVKEWFEARRFAVGNTPPILTLSATGSVFNGGMTIRGATVQLDGTNHTFNGTLLAEGNQEYPNNYANAGYLKIEGANNTFGPGQFELNPAGWISIKYGHDFSSVSNFAFKGGTLGLGDVFLGSAPAYVANAFNALHTNFAVARGVLFVANGAALGTDLTRTVTLGSPGHYGVLRGQAASTNVNTGIYHPIILQGNGGMFDPWYAWNHIYVCSRISGTGELIKVGGKDLYVANGTNTAPNADTYSGGTRIVGGYSQVQSFRTVGTGNVRIEAGRLHLTSSTNVAPGASVWVGRLGANNLILPAVLHVSADFLPTLDPNSTGALMFENTGANINARLMQPYGMMYIGGTLWTSCNATNIAPNPDGVYRLLGGSQYEQTFGGANAFVGTNRMIVGVPGNAAGWYSGACLRNINSFSGDIVVHPMPVSREDYTQYGSMLLGRGISGGSPWGNTNADVYAYAGHLKIENQYNAGAKPVKKNRLVYDGGCKFSAFDISGPTADNVASLDVNELVRTNGATLMIWHYANRLGYSNSQFRVLSNPPVPANGMVAPHMVGPSGFLNYDTAYGFTNAAFTHTLAGPNFTAGLNAGTEIVEVTGAAILQDNPSIYALRTTKAISLNGANNTLTLVSGGLILNSTAYDVTPKIVFGTASATPSEGFIYAGGTLSAGTAPKLASPLYANGIIKFGPGGIRLYGDNVGTLTNRIVINDGMIAITNANALGGASVDVVMNGGQLHNAHSGGVNINNRIFVGPAGGRLSDNYQRLGLVGTVADLEPGNAGPLMIGGGYITIYTNLSFSGGFHISGVAPLRIEGGTSIGSGPVYVTDNNTINVFTTAGMLVCTNRFSFEKTGTLCLTKYPVRAGSIQGVGRILFGERYTGVVDLTLMTGIDNTDSDFYGPLYDLSPGYTGKLVKEGTGTLTLWGQSYYKGQTIVSNGTLAINGSIDLSSKVLVKTGATLGGKGTINAPLELETGATLTGSLTLGTNISLAAGSAYVAILGGASETGKMSLTGNGAVNLAGATLTLTLAAAPTVGQTFTLLNNQGSLPIQNQFSCGRLITAVFENRTYTFSINYTGGDGNDIVLTSLPIGTVWSIK
jgi:autotransporter-associated beta strand protein